MSTDRPDAPLQSLAATNRRLLAIHELIRVESGGMAAFPWLLRHLSPTPTAEALRRDLDYLVAASVLTQSTMGEGVLCYRLRGKGYPPSR
jgi:hypothetical protein